MPAFTNWLHLPRTGLAQNIELYTSNRRRPQAEANRSVLPDFGPMGVFTHMGIHLTRINRSGAGLWGGSPWTARDALVPLPDAESGASERARAPALQHAGYLISLIYLPPGASVNDESPSRTNTRSDRFPTR